MAFKGQRQEHRNKGVVSLATELGINPGTVSKALKSGVTPEQIRKTYAPRIARGESLQRPGTRMPYRTEGKTKGRKRKKPAEPEVEVLTAANGYVPSVQLHKRPGIPASVRSTPIPVPEVDETEEEEVPVGVAESWVDARTRKEIAQADERELIVAQKQAELVPQVMVRRYFGEMYIKTRDALLRIGPELGDQLATEESPAECALLIEGKIREALGMLQEFSL